MGPHAFACGNHRPQLGSAPGGAASMGPHAFACGDTMHSHQSPPTEQASMGPHAFACGNYDPDLPICWSHDLLQWGRTLLRAETAYVLFAYSIRLSLAGFEHPGVMDGYFVLPGPFMGENGRSYWLERPSVSTTLPCCSTALYDYCRVLLREVLATKDLHRRDPALPVGDGADIEQDDAVFARLDQSLDPRGEPHPILAPKKASEDAVLQRAPKGFRQLMHCAQPLSIRNIIREDIGPQHDQRVVNGG